MDVRADPLEPAEQLRVIVERQIGMKAVDNVDFGQWLMSANAQFVPGLLERHRIRTGITGFEPSERTKQAARDADVSRLEPDVVVVEGSPAVPLLAILIRKLTDRQEIGAVEQPAAVRQRQPFTGIELLCDVEEMSVCKPRAHGRAALRRRRRSES